jgi:adenine-specific DNA-methyltransferase
MGDELLKKTGAGNLFMIFGEPDISIDRDDRGQVVVEIRGLARISHHLCCFGFFT